MAPLPPPWPLWPGWPALAVGAGAVTAMKLGKEKSDSGAETKKD